MDTMFAIKDLLALLEEWPKWKRIRDTPDNLDTLAQRVSELETRLARCPGEGCPRCGELAFRVQRSEPDAMLGVVGGMAHYMKCEKCAFEDKRIAKP